MYFVSSLGGVAIVKFMNYHYDFTSWWFFALASRSTWILSLGLHGGLVLFQQHHKSTFLPSLAQVRIYGLVAMGLSVVELFNSYSMSILPGSLYMMLKGSDVGWSMLLSYLCLPANSDNANIAKKRYTWGQVTAAGLIMAGIAMVFLLDDGSIILRNKQVEDENDDCFDNSKLTVSASTTTTTTDHITDSYSTASTSIMRAAILCLVGAFLNALCSVGTEAMLKKTLQQEEERLRRQLHHENGDNDKSYDSEMPLQPSKLFLSNAYSMWTSFFSFVLLGIPALWKELSSRNTGNIDSSANSLLPSLSSPDTPIATLTTTTINPGDAMVGLCLVLLILSRFLERLAKYIICVFDSAVTFSVVQAARRWSGIYIVGILFHRYEHLLASRGMLVGSLISGLGFLLHAREATVQSTTPIGSTPNSHSSETAAEHVYEKINAKDDASDIAVQKLFTSGTLSQAYQTDNVEMLPVCDGENNAIEMPIQAPQ